MDKIAKEKRSEIMRKVKGSETKLELSLRSSLWRLGLRYRVRNQKYFGKPDILVKRKKTVVFIDSCFWHGCKFHLRLPEANGNYWLNKINRNKKRDTEVEQYYKNNNWHIFRLWEHDIKSKIQVETVSKQLAKKLSN